MEVIAMFFIIVILSIAVSQRLKTKIENAIPISFMGMVILVYILGLFGMLRYCIYFINIITVISFIYIVYSITNHIRNKKIEEFADRIITPGFIVFCLLYILFLLITKNRILEFIDEFRHWGMAVKSMFESGEFLGKHMRFTEYPPFTAIFEYIFLMYKGEFSESTILFAFSIIHICMMINIFKNIEWEKNINKLILYIPLIILLPVFFYNKNYIRIIVDGLLGIFFAYIVYTWFAFENNKLIRNISIILGLISITLIKSTGIYFAIFAIIIFIVDLIITRKNNTVIKNDFLFIVISIIVSLVILFSWNVMIKLDNAEKEWDINSSFIDKSVDIIKGNGNENDIEVIKNFIKSIFVERTVISERNLTVFSVGLLLLCFNIYVLNKIDNIELRKRYKTLNICLFIECIIYLIALLVMYLFLFTEFEASYLSSYDRYISSILLGMVATNIFIFLEIQKNSRFSMSNIVAICSIIIIFIPVNCLSIIYTDNYKLQESQKREQYTEILKYKDMIDNNDDVYFISNDNDEYAFGMSKYLFVPKYIRNTEDSVNKDIVEIKDVLLKDYEYIYIHKVDDQYVARNQQYFEGNMINNKTLYKINKENKNIVLEEINILYKK